MEFSYNYLKTSKAQTWASYPYTGTAGSCKYSEVNGIVNTIGYRYAASKDPNSMIAALKVQPLAVGVAGDKSAFQLYSSGILSSSTCGTSLNHAIVLVGYGQSSSGTPFWIAKNSWGTSWGESGYVRILRDTVAGGAGICGINLYVVYPVIQ
jgi:hypothetical protein